MRRFWTGPTGLAVILTVLNAAKPAVVDDTAYLLFAKHLAADPGHPYAFELFWYREPEPAMRILMPPVVPYALVPGYLAFGDQLFLWKLTLFPFAAVLCHALAFLFRRFARGAEDTLLPMAVLGPAVLPLFNVMLDVPALALGMAAVACFVRGCDRDRVGWVAAAGVLAGLAMQTKYSMLPVPAVLLWYAILTRRVSNPSACAKGSTGRLLFGLAAPAVAVAVFWGWESVVERIHGESHFLHHLQDQGSRGGLGEVLTEKAKLFQPMVSYLGGLGIGWGLLAAASAGVPRRLLVGAAVAGAVGVAAVCVLPFADTVVLRKPVTGTPKLDLAVLVFGTLGTGVLVAAVWAMGVLFRPGIRRGFVRWSPDSWFVCGWLMIEIAAYFALTPFPAGRRVIGICAVLGILAGRTAVLTRFHRRETAVPGWIAGVTVAAGLGLFAIDTWDAYPERELGVRAAEVAGDGGPHAVWFQGHWGFQYYCDRAGMRLVVPGVSKLRAGDRLVVPVLPDPVGFYRPYHGGATFRLDPAAVELLAEFVWDDALSAQTVPNLYGGVVSVRGRDHPRLRVAVYRVTRDWVPE